MDKAIERIDAKLADFRGELAKSEGIVQSQQAKIGQLTTQIDTLSTLRAELEELRSTEEECSSSQSVHDNGRLPPSEAIAQLLTNQPGLLALEIIEVLEHQVQTVAKDIPHNLRTTLFNMEKRGTLVRDAEKRYRVAERQEE